MKMTYYKYPMLSKVLPSLLILLTMYFQTINTASCEGSVVFYWKENATERQTQERNWGRLEKEKEINRNRGKLSTFFDTKSAYAYKVNGDCCWEIYGENGYKGDKAKLVPTLVSGFGGIPGYPKFNVNSIKKIKC